MAYVRIPGGMWVPWTLAVGYGTGGITIPLSSSDALLLDADEEEVQLIGRVVMAAGPGTTKTFGTSGSAVEWLPGASIAFVSSATLRVGVKKSSTIDAANGPPARATIGAAAFDVYDDLIGGTDTITSTTWRSDAMTAGTPYTVTHGDLIAICFHLDVVSGTQSIKVRGGSSAQLGFPTATLYTGTYASSAAVCNAVLKFDDGTWGWIDGSYVASVFGGSENIGNTNIYGNVINLPFACKVDAMMGIANVSVGTTAPDVGVWLGSDPSAPLTGSISHDPQITANNSGILFPFTSLITLSASTDYVVGVKQNSATAIGIRHFDVNTAAHLQASGLDATCYATKSAAGAAFAAENSGKRRAGFWLRIAEIDIPTGGGSGGGLHLIGAGGLAG